jgi:hypothetical protein
MNSETIELIDLIVTNALVIWLALRMVKRVDDIDLKVDKHETRITVLEKVSDGS